MRRAFLLSVRLHVRWFLESFGKRGRQLTPLTPRRLVILLLFMPAYTSLQMLHWIGFLLDEIFFRGYRSVQIKEPLIITGIPRSGTTFIHRTLAQDTAHFTTFRTWEAILAPSIAERRFLHSLARVDRWVGRPLRRLLNAVTNRFTDGFAHVHSVGLDAPEEDYLCLLPAAGCFILVLILPGSSSLWQLGRFQEVPDDERETLVNFYKACLKKHLYVAGPNRRLLSKNAAFASWVPDLRLAFPDARYIICVRAPKPALLSQLSSIRAGVLFFGSGPAADTFSLEFQTVMAHAYRILRDEKDSFLVDHLAVIDQAQLKESTGKVLYHALKQLCIPLNPELQTILAEADRISREHKSQHQHVPLSTKMGPREFDLLVTDLYEEIIKHPHLRRNEPIH